MARKGAERCAGRERLGDLAVRLDKEEREKKGQRWNAGRFFSDPKERMGSWETRVAKKKEKGSLVSPDLLVFGCVIERAGGFGSCPAMPCMGCSGSIGGVGIVVVGIVVVAALTGGVPGAHGLTSPSPM